MKVTIEDKKVHIYELSKKEAKAIATALANQAQSASEVSRSGKLVESQKLICIEQGKFYDELALSLMDGLEEKIEE